MPRWPPPFYASNMFFEHAAADYFGPAVERNSLLHTWSLGVEEQFYLVWPCLMWVACRGGGRRRVWLLGVLAAGSFACSFYATRLVPAFRLLFAAGASLGIRGGRSSGSCACSYGSHTPYPVGRRRWRRWHADDPRDGGMGNRRCGLSRLDRRPSRRGDIGGPESRHNSAASRHERGARHRSVAIRRRAILFLVSLALTIS